MNIKLNIFLLVFISCSIGSISANAQVEDEVVPISEIFTFWEKDNYGGYPPDVITGTGFDDTDYTTIPSPWPTNHPSLWLHQGTTSYREEWQSNYMLNSATSINAKVGWAIFDLGSVKNLLSELYIWNVRESTLRNTISNNIYYASTPTVSPPHGPTGGTQADCLDYDFASGGWTLLSSQNFNVSGRTANDPADSIVSLGGVSARYIAIEIMSNNGDANRVGLAEVGITLTPPPAGTMIYVK